MRSFVSASCRRRHSANPLAIVLQPRLNDFVNLREKRQLGAAAWALNTMHLVSFTTALSRFGRDRRQAVASIRAPDASDHILR